MGMALDEPQETDLTFTDRGINYLIDKNLFEEIKPINIDFIDTAGGGEYKISSNLRAGKGCNSGCC